MENRYNRNIRGSHNIKNMFFPVNKSGIPFFVSLFVKLEHLFASFGLVARFTSSNSFYDLFGTGNFFTSPIETTSLIKTYGDC